MIRPGFGWVLFYFPNRKYNFLKKRIRATSTCAYAKARRELCFLYEVRKELLRTRKLGDLHYSFKNKENNTPKNDVDSVLSAYELLVHRVSDIILVMQSNGDILDANDVAVEKYGYSRPELLAMNIAELTTDRADFKTHLGKGYIYETTHRKKDGNLLNVQVNSQCVAINNQEVNFSIIRDITAQKIMETQLYYVARHDYLTGLANQYGMIEYICQISGRPGLKLGSLILINIDNFKIANDIYGYSAGNSILKKIAKCFQSQLRATDFFARLGKDEFAIILTDINKEEVKVLANKLLYALKQESFILGESIIKISASIGIAITEAIQDIDSAFSYADAAMRAAKEEGKNRVVIIQKVEDRMKVMENNRILSLLNDAVKKNNFKLFLQPICRNENDVLHYEALIRMIDENGDILEPATFISLAERYGLMTQIDQWVIKTAIELLENRQDLNLFVNISGESLGDDLLLRWIESRINNSTINPSRIGFEITETTAIKNIAKAEQWINRLKALGCDFALDDFGVGFSSFSHLHTLPIDYLKIDGSFIRDLDSDNTKRALVKAMIGVAHILGKKTIAEFVENENIWHILNEMQVDYGQGYYLGRPHPICNV
ncbi:MAG: gmr 3 [Firmicutes bacterium]|nr:gmr 3 [Bacillota bacterium]